MRKIKMNMNVTLNLSLKNKFCDRCIYIAKALKNKYNFAHGELFTNSECKITRNELYSEAHIK